MKLIGVVPHDDTVHEYDAEAAPSVHPYQLTSHAQAGRCFRNLRPAEACSPVPLPRSGLRSNVKEERAHVLMNLYPGPFLRDNGGTDFLSGDGFAIGLCNDQSDLVEYVDRASRWGASLSSAVDVPRRTAGHRSSCRLHARAIWTHTLTFGGAPMRSAWLD